MIAGPLKLAEEVLTKDNESGLFFVFNSDIICEFPLQKLIEFHKAHGKEGTIMVILWVFSSSISWHKLKSHQSMVLLSMNLMEK